MKKTHSTQPGAAVFDMDGLMLDTESIYQRAWQQAANDLGYRIKRTISFFNWWGGARKIAKR